MDCAGAARSVTVSARLPRKVRAGSSFVVEISSDLPDGAVQVAATRTTPAAFSIGADEQPSTVQLVAGGRRGRSIDLSVAGATYVVVDPSVSPPTSTRVDCVPRGVTRLGSVHITGGKPGPPATAPVDAAVALRCTDKFGHPMANMAIRVAFSTPTRIAEGGTYTLADLLIEAPPGAGVRIAAAGTDQPFITPWSVQTVTAPAGGIVDHHVELVGLFAGSFFVGSCTPLGPAHLAAIPVTPSP
jgi:hypothetical protein